MNKNLSAAFYLLLLVVATMIGLWGLKPATQDVSVSGVIEKTQAAVVQIKGPNSEGSGFIVASDGVIVTNQHIAGAMLTHYEVKLADGRTFQATPRPLQTFQDIAILEIEAENLPTLPLGDSDEVKVGESVVSLGRSVSAGILSAKNVIFEPGLTKFLQSDALIRPGSSGGPLVNMQGEVIGVNTAYAKDSTAGYAVPINEVKNLLFK